MLQAVMLVTILLNTGGSYGGFGGFYIGGEFPQMDNINSVLSEHDIPEVQSPIYSMGGGGYALIGNVFLGGSGFGGTGTSETDSLKVLTSVGGGCFEFGLQRSFVRSLIGYLFLGVGGYSLMMEFRPRLKDASFEEVLENPQRSSILSVGGLLLETAAALQYWLALGKKPSFLSIMVKGGAKVTPTLGDWKLHDGAEVLSAPSLGKIHPFLTVGIFLGGRAPVYTPKG